MIGHAARIAAAAVLVFASAGRAGAVDRTLGADVPLPPASGAAWTPADRAALARDLDAEVAASAVLHGAHVGLLATDAQTGAVLYARAADDAFQPASTLKLLTGSVALDTLRAAPPPRTTAALVPLAGGGPSDLVVTAGGDPALGPSEVDAIAGAVAAAGVRRLHAVRVDARRYAAEPYAPGWAADDLVYDYAPVVSALAFNDNAFSVSVRPGSQPGAPPQLSVDPPAACVENRALTAAANASATLDVMRDGTCIAVTGAIAADDSQETLGAAFPDPLRAFADALAAALAVRGVAVADPRAAPVAPLGGGRPAVVYTHDGAPLADRLADMWEPSDNLSAEMLLREIGLAGGTAPGSTDGGLAAERAWLGTIGVDPATVGLADGSGLSAYDRLTPRALVAILAHDWAGPERNVVLGDLPIAGVRGTLRSRFAGTAAARRVFAKTGTLTHVRALAGYLATRRHGTVIFALLIDDWLGDAQAGGPDALDAERARVLSRIIDG